MLTWYLWRVCRGRYVEFVKVRFSPCSVLLIFLQTKLARCWMLHWLLSDQHSFLQSYCPLSSWFVDLAVKILLLIVLRDIILCLIGTCKQFIKLKRWPNCHSWFIGNWKKPWPQTPQWYRWVHRIPHLIGFCGSSFSVIHVLGMLVWLFVVSMLLKTNFLTGRNLKNLWNFVWHILAWHFLFVFF